MIIHSVCLSFCEQDNWRSGNGRRPNNGRHGQVVTLCNWLTSGADPDPHVDSGSPFSFFHHRGTWHCRRLLTISHSVTGWFLRNLAQWPTPTRQWIHNILAAIQQTSGSSLIRKSWLESRITFDWHFSLRGVCTPWVLLLVYIIIITIIILYPRYLG